MVDVMRQRGKGASRGCNVMGGATRKWVLGAVLLAAATTADAEAGSVLVPVITRGWIDGNQALWGLVTLQAGVATRASRKDYIGVTTCADYGEYGIGCQAGWSTAFRVGTGSSGEDVAQSITEGLFGGGDHVVGETGTVGEGDMAVTDGSLLQMCWEELDGLGGNPSYDSLEDMKRQSWPGGGVGCVSVSPRPIPACLFDAPTLNIDHGVVSVDRPDEKSNSVTMTCTAPMSVRFALEGGGSSVSGGPGISAEISLDKEALPVKKNLVVGKNTLTLSSTLTAARDALSGQFSGAGVLKYEVD